MKKEQALGIVYNCLDSEDAVTVKLRSGQGLDVEQFDALIQAINVLINEYENEEFIPKRLALCFVDITNFFYYTEDIYTEAEIDQIEDAGLKLSELANKLFGEN